jgi:hypothetical protein
MTDIILRSYAAWSPGIEEMASWRTWAEAPAPLELAGKPDVAFLPAMLRRRCSALTRIMLATAFDCCGPDELESVRTVFASRHGNINESVDLLERLARRQPLSPARFSHTVHNAQAGLYSIAANNRQSSSSIAAHEDTFASGFLEALCQLQRDPGRPVLLVMADIPLEETFAPLVDEPVAAYGLALLLAVEGNGDKIRFEPCSLSAPTTPKPWPDAIEFLRWLLGDEPRLELQHYQNGWAWERVG